VLHEVPGAATLTRGRVPIREVGSSFPYLWDRGIMPNRVMNSSGQLERSLKAPRVGGSVGIVMTGPQAQQLHGTSFPVVSVWALLSSPEGWDDDDTWPLYSS
jgi:hypothetical protein